jgi:hypothetical protein
MFPRTRFLEFGVLRLYLWMTAQVGGKDMGVISLLGKETVDQTMSRSILGTFELDLFIYCLSPIYQIYLKYLAITK